MAIFVERGLIRAEDRKVGRGVVTGGILFVGGSEGWEKMEWL